MPRMSEDTPRGQSRSESADTSGESGWITTDVAARAVRVSPRTIRRYIERGELEAKPQGEGVRREWLISVDSLHALRATRPPSADVPEGEREGEHADRIAGGLRGTSAPPAGGALISVGSLHALRATRPPSADVPEVDREVEHADSIADVLRDTSASLVARAEEAAELRARLAGEGRA